MYNKSDVNSSPYESNILLIIIYHLNQNLEPKILKLISSVTDGEIYIRHPTPHIQMIVSYFNLITMFTLYIYIYIYIYIRCLEFDFERVFVQAIHIHTCEYLSYIFI